MRAHHRGQSASTSAVPASSRAANTRNTRDVRRSRIKAGLLAAGSLFLSATMTAPAAHAVERVTIDAANNLATDRGTPLRGAPFFLDAFSIGTFGGGMETQIDVYEEYFKRAVRENNLNAVRCAPWIGMHAAYNFGPNQAEDQRRFDILLDNCVQWAEDEDIYAIVNYHTQFQTDLDPELVKRFWDRYAPRYQSKKHVVFELVNEPQIGSARDHMDEIYTHVRPMAPSTHMILWSLFDPTEITADEIKASTPSIRDYKAENVSVGWHNYRDVDDYSTYERAASFASAGLPVINTEYWSLEDRDDLPISYGHIADNVRELENRGFSWFGWGPYLNYEATSVGDTHDMVKFTSTYRDAVRNGATTSANNAGLSNGDFRQGLDGQYWTKWQGAISTGTSDTPTFTNTVRFGTTAGQVDLSGAFTARAEYSAAGRRDLVLEVFEQSTGRWLGQNTVTVEPGTGTRTLTANVGAISAGDYRLKLGIRNVGADWRNTYQDVYRDNVKASANGSGGGSAYQDPTINLNAGDADELSPGVQAWSGTGVGYFGPGRWIKFSRVDLGRDNGYSDIRARISTAGSGRMEVRAQKVDGPVVATIDFSGNSYSFNDGIWRSAKFAPWTWDQDLYFVVTSGWANLGDIQIIDNN